VRVPDFAIVLFGAGHVGRAVIRVLATLDCHVQWVDTRDGRLPPLRCRTTSPASSTDAPDAEVAGAPPGAYFW
jgi:xanthine dehydrogenase accessory factor